MNKERYFQCRNCGQVVQGWHAAMEWINCCDNKDMAEIEGPEEYETVAAVDACPSCGEDRVDYLLWDEDGAEIQCQSCGDIYVRFTAANDEVPA